MFGNAYFGNRYFGDAYFGPMAGAPAAAEGRPWGGLWQGADARLQPQPQVVYTRSARPAPLMVTLTVTRVTAQRIAVRTHVATVAAHLVPPLALRVARVEAIHLDEEEELLALLQDL